MLTILKKSKFAAVLKVLFIIFLGAVPCHSFETKMSFTLSGQYQDNLLFDKTDKINDSISSVLSSALIQKKTERLETNLSGTCEIKRYKKHRYLSSENIFTEGQLSWKSTEKTLFSSSFHYEQDSDIDRYLSDSGILLDTSKKNVLSSGSSIRKRFTERISSEFSINFLKEKISPANTYEASGQTELSSQGFSGGLFSQINETTNLQLTSGYSLYDYGETDVSQLFLSAGTIVQYNETINFSFSSGARYTTYRYEVPVGIDFSLSPPQYIYDTKNKGLRAIIGNASCSFTFDDCFLKFSVDENLKPSSGQSQSVARTSAGLFWRHNLSNTFKYSLALSFYYNRSDSSAGFDPLSSKAINTFSTVTWKSTDRLSLSVQHAFYDYRYSADIKNKNIYNLLLDYSFD